MTAPVSDPASRASFALWAKRVRARLVPHANSESVLLGLGGLIGLATGLLAAALVGLLRIVQVVAFGSHPSLLRTLLAPTVGAFVVGLLVMYLASEPSGGGIVEVMRTIALRGGRFRGRVPFAMLAESSIALGSGGSGGREAPIVLGGGAIGSLIGRLFAVDEDRMRTLVAAGAGAGIGASFNAPIGGMLFAIELFLGKLKARSLQVVVLASVAASVTARELIGPEIVFQPGRGYELHDPRELIGYAAIGLLAVAVGVVFIEGEHLAERAFRKLKLWLPLRLALGGLIVGLIALAAPEVLGTGHQLPPIFGVREPIRTMVQGGFGHGASAAALLGFLLVAKLVATIASVGSGNAVGSLMPTLFTGAALGGAVGHLLQVVLPGAGISPGAFALVGMAAVFAAAARTPLTAILIVFELTGDYGLVLPLMLAAGLATFLADRVLPDGLYTAPLRRAGITYEEPDDIDVMQTVTVGEVMTTDPDTVPADMPLPEVRATFERTRHHGFPVVEGDRLVGVITVSDLTHAERTQTTTEGRAQLLAADVATRDPLTTTPSAPVYRALHHMAAYDVGRLPVVAEEDHSRLVGLLRRSDVMHAYQRAVQRGVARQQREERSKLRDLVGVHFSELVVQPDAYAAGKCVSDVAWPPRTILTSIRRGGQVLLPDGRTVIEPGDEVVVLTGPDHAESVEQLLTAPGEPPDQGV